MSVRADAGLLRAVDAAVEARRHDLEAAREAACAEGQQMHLVGLDFGCDGALLAALYGVPAAAFGRGKIDQAQATDESGTVDDLVGWARTYSQVPAG